jgi:beta-glucosidase-like glycosyl hydrolase
MVMARMSEGDELDLVSGSTGTVRGPDVGNTPALAQLCIPAMGFEDGPRGPGEGHGNVTQLPSPVAAAATLDTGLEEQYGAIVGTEQAAPSATVDLGPTINIVRDPRWGRASETFSEDPYLTGEMTAAFVRGLKSQGEMAHVKHFAVHSQESVRNTGLDSDMVGERAMQEIHLYAAIPNQPPRAYLDDMVERILTEMFDHGLFEHHPTGSFTSAAHRAVATRVAEESTVLLKSSGHLLPLDVATVGSIAVIGADATAPVYAGAGSTGVLPNHPVTPLEGLEAAAGGRVAVTYSDGADRSSAAAAARAAKVAVVFADYTEGEEADRSTIDLGAAQDSLIRAVAAANPRTVVVLNAGSAVTMGWLGSVRCVLDQWYPGEVDGTAIADVLFGRADPSGHLPVTFPTSLSRVPASTPLERTGANGQVDYNEGMDVGYRWYQSKGLTLKLLCQGDRRVFSRISPFRAGRTGRAGCSVGSGEALLDCLTAGAEDGPQR